MKDNIISGNSRLACGCIETDDPIIFEATSRPWEVLSEPLGTQSFYNLKHYVATESVVLYREYFSAPTRLRGISPPGMLVVVVPLQLGEGTRFFGRDPQSSVINFSAPGPLDAVVDAHNAHFILLMGVEFLQRELGEEATLLLETAVQRRSLAVEPEDFAAFCDWLDHILATAGPRSARGQVRRRIIRKARPNPEKAEQLTAVLEHQMPRRLLALCRAPGRKLLRPRVGKSRSAVISRALDYLTNGPSSMPSVGELCQVAGAKQRTLEYAFEERFGLSPLRFVKVYRLHQVRRDLAAAKPRSTRVADVAAAHGFRHLSRFSLEYKELFDELPSKTLARKPRVVSAAPLICSSDFPLKQSPLRSSGVNAGTA
ncbi:helix-turn-helix domain-containing protein [Thiorhodovibrio frisius]|uniref:DNA-binding domain-containing protein, AraC-type n=1 Tax=Thiorhodovibrio frisius TaxID=631362 RepID=H8Z6W8_9GAMM|nr:helix-turn-helix domain-containing protein [Thiorhodovibrio frisius]EIC19753.1 DNA-binding domain-containing protein, AraC-type [Thiorhodovibrio frisius]WPL20278.1 transcriptional regulator EutR [Thiorhodovibrio frisius]